MSDEAVFEIKPHDQVVLIVVRKRILDEPSTRKLTDGVLTAAAETPRLPVVLDLGQVKFAPSVALGSLVQLSNSFKFDRRRIVLIGIGPRIYDAMRVTRLDKVLEIHDTLEQVIGPA
jgi:anti-anti-sigma factor